MKKFKLLIISSFLLLIGIMVSSFITYNGISEDDNGTNKLLSDTVTPSTDSTTSSKDVTTPEEEIVREPDQPYRSNESKPYKSNIPDSWYDEASGFGSRPDGEEGSGISDIFLDFLNEDATINYNTGYDIPIIEIHSSEVTSFYIDLGYVGFEFYSGVQSADQINVSMYSDIATLDITQNYQGVGTTYFTTEIGSTYSGSVYNTTNTSLEYVSDQEYTYNEDYRMYKLTITPHEVGYAYVTLDPNYIGSGNGDNCYFSFILHIYDSEYDLLVYDEAYFIENDLYFPLSLTDESIVKKGFPINIEDIENYYFSYEPNFITYGDENYSYTYALTSINDNLEIYDGWFYASEEGTYDVIVIGIFTLNFPSYFDTEFTNYESIIIKKQFKIKLNIYNEETLSVDFGLSTGNKNIVYIEEGQDLDLTIDLANNDYLDVTYWLNNQESEGYIDNVSSGTYEFTIKLYNNMTSETISKTTTIIVDSNENIYQSPIIDSNNITYNIGESSTASVNITNNSYLSQYAELETKVIQGGVTYEVVSDASGTSLLINGASLGKNVIEITADYGSETKSTLLTVNGVSSYEFALDKTVVEMDVNSEDKIRVGFIYDGIFTSLNENEDYYILVSLSDNEITATLNSSNEIVITSGSSSKQVTGTVVIIINDIMIDAFNFTVIVGEDYTNVIDTEIDIVEGSTLRLLLGDKTASINVNLDPIVSGRGYDFDWISLNNKVASVLKTDELSAKITAVGVGSTEIIAICQTEDGSTITARTTIIVLDTIPEVHINVESLTNTNSALTIYDLLSVSINNNGFNFSSQISIEWYIDDERITTALDSSENTIALTNKQNSFYYKLSEGLHNINAVITDAYYGFEVTATKEINISPLEYQERQLSFTESEISLVLKGTDYKLDVLLDGAINNEYTYLWSIDDSKVVSIEMTSGSSAIIKPMSAGETYINAFTNIGKYEDRIIRTQIKVIVEELSTVELSLQNEFNKPGDNVKISVLVNGKTGFKNFEPNIEITSGSEEVKYVYEDGIIIIENAQSGKFSTKLRYGMDEVKTSFEVTSFNFKEFILTILPYLIIVLVISVFLFAIFKANSNPFKKIQKTVNKLELLTTQMIEVVSSDKTKAHNSYKKLLKATKSLNNSLHYFFDEGVDEFKHTISNAEALVKILVALINSPNAKETKSSVVLNNLKNKQIKNIIDNVNEIINSRIKYDENVKKIMSQGDAKTGKKKKHKMTYDEYHQYLIDKGILIIEDEVPDEDDDSNN